MSKGQNELEAPHITKFDYFVTTTPSLHGQEDAMHSFPELYLHNDSSSGLH